VHEKLINAITLIRSKRIIERRSDVVPVTQGLSDSNERSRSNRSTARIPRIHSRPRFTTHAFRSDFDNFPGATLLPASFQEEQKFLEKRSHDRKRDDVQISE